MAINPKVFFDGVRVRLFSKNGVLTQQQVNGMNAILTEWDRRKLVDLRHLSYMLATAYWETDRTMWPIEEYGKGAGRTYGTRDPITGQTYFGRGFVQLTWKTNYDTMGKLLGVDLVNKPELALDLAVASGVMFEGMIRGSFTGMALKDCFGPNLTDWVKARKIINGTDRDSEIAEIAKAFFEIVYSASV